MTGRTQEAAPSHKVVLLVLIAALALVRCAGPSGVPISASPQPGEPWTTYLGNNARAGFQPTQRGLSPSSPLHLRLLWSSRSGGPISVQPVVARGLIYWGSWDGYVRATDLSGRTVWKTFLGQTSVPAKSGCLPAPLGVASTASVADLGTRSVLYAGGTDTFFALDALTGNVIWKTPLGSEEGTFLWSSPAVYQGSVYEGISSWGDCPLTQGRVVQMSAADGTIQHTFNVAPAGCVGATVWGSPTID